MNKFKLEKVRYENCKLRRRVKLAFPDRLYILDEGNPAIGTRHECAGTIEFFMKVFSVDDGIAVRVLWDNGSQNCYKEDELVYIGKDEDVLTRKIDDRGEYISIW